MFLKSKTAKTPPADGEVKTEAIQAPTPTVNNPQSEAPPYLPGVFLSRLLRHQHLMAAGPETSYENEPWAPELSVGLFRKRRAVTEEQSSSLAGTQ